MKKLRFPDKEIRGFKTILAGFSLQFVKRLLMDCSFNFMDCNDIHTIAWRSLGKKKVLVPLLKFTHTAGLTPSKISSVFTADTSSEATNRETNKNLHLSHSIKPKQKDCTEC